MAVKQAAEWSDKVEQILKLFPVHIRKVMEQAEVFQRLSQKLEEIRVRVNQPLELVTADGAYFLNNGALVRQTDRQCLSVSEEDLRQMSTLMSRYSLYAYEEEIRQGLNNLASVLEKKSYFVVSSSTSPIPTQIPWKKMLLKKERYVSPCGDFRKKQCPDGCEEEITEVTETDRENLQHCYEELRAGKFLSPNLGKCPKCGKNMILNNVYAAKYDERGYLENWTTYQTWLQNTLNHKMVLLEIGEGNRFPSIIKNPFQRIALFQQKAGLYCVDGEQNPIAWLLSLC